MNNTIYNNKINEKAWEIGEAFLKGILLEVSAFPKPGLVSSISTGSHKDMNILTFMVGSAGISPCFTLCAQAGIDHQGDPKELLDEIRQIGIVYEKNLLKSTKGVNTQRGVLFAAGILCGAAGLLVKRNYPISSQNLFDTAASLTEGLVKRELESLDSKKEKLTAGEKLFLKYKARGIRGEVENGFPSVAKVALPAFKYALKKNISLNHSLVHTLISLITVVEDTTILWRKDMETLYKVKNMAKEVLASDSVFSEIGMKKITEMDKELIKENISPGGSADLLAVTVGVYLLENEHFPVQIK